MVIEERTVDLGDASVHARVTGEGERALVLIHGTEADGSMWGPYMEGLAGGRRVYALDLPGHGASELPSDLDCSPAGIAGWFNGFVAKQRPGMPASAREGQTFFGIDAVNVDMIDAVGSADDAMAELREMIQEAA